MKKVYKEQVIELISSEIRLIWLDKSYSQEKMADIMDISKSHLSKLKKVERYRVGQM